MPLAQLKAKVKYVPDLETETNYLALQKTLRRIIMGTERKRQFAIENRSERRYNKAEFPATGRGVFRDSVQKRE